MNIFIFLANKADEFLAIDLEFRILVRFCLVLAFFDIRASKLVPGARKRGGDLLFEEGVVVDPSKMASERALLPSVLELSKMFHNVAVLLQAYSADSPDLLSVNEVVSCLVDMAQVVPHLLRSEASACVHLLRGSNILSDEDSNIGVVKLPVLEADRICVGIGASGTTIDVASTIGNAKE